MKWSYGLVLMLVCFSCNENTDSKPASELASADTYVPDATKKYIYLSFDDGPLYGSDKIDSIILQEKIKFNVFLVGKHIYKTTELKDYYIRYTKNPHIKLYNHSFTHANDDYGNYYKNDSNVIADMKKK